MAKNVKGSFYYYGVPSTIEMTFSAVDSTLVSLDIYGNVIAKKLGKTKVTAKTPDGSYSSFTVNVTGNPVIVDLSKWQGTIDWAKASSVIDFAILRTQFGAKIPTTYWEDRYQEYSDNCVKYNIPFGVYDFCRFTSATKAKAEAKLFFKTATENGKMPTIFFLDIEPYNNDEIYAKGKVRTNVRAFIKQLRSSAKAKYGERVKVGIYIAHHRYDAYNLDVERDLADPATPDVIWVPMYGKNDGKVPSSNPSHPCDIWQYTSAGKVSGIAGNVDMNTLLNNKGKKISQKDWFTFSYLTVR
jgi:GH25 family lysozyme M1 (1,4-beta-N-acetylmuramidase)